MNLPQMLSHLVSTTVALALVLHAALDWAIVTEGWICTMNIILVTNTVLVSLECLQAAGARKSLVAWIARGDCMRETLGWRITNGLG
jgi:hypothetical protein